MRFDLATAMTITALLTLCVGASLTFAASRYPPDLRAAIRVWVGGLLLQTLALLGVAVLGSAPAAAVTVVANTVYALTFVEMAAAVALFAGRPRRRLPLLLVGAVALNSLLLGVIWPHSDWRVAINALPLALLQLNVARAVLGGGRTLRPADWLTGALFLACAALALSRGTVELVGPALDSHAAVALMRNIVFVFSAILPTIGTIGFMLMCGDRLNDDLARLAMIDPLTGAYNRRTLAGLVENAIASARETHQPLSLLVLDVDHFKHINDELGHEVGDETLIGLVALMRASLRDGQALSRLGGEEFAILLPDTDRDTAFGVAERLRQQVAAAPLAIAGHRLELRVSIGVATFSDDVCDLASLLRRADRALYAAKRGGRDRVVVAAAMPAQGLAQSLDTTG